MEEETGTTEFITRAKEIHKRANELLTPLTLKERKVNWKELWSVALKDLMEQLRKIQVAIDANEEITPLRVSLIETVLDDTLIIATLSKLGMDMAKVDKRLAQVEEDIKRMKSQLRS